MPTRHCPPTHLDVTRNPVSAVRYDGTNGPLVAALTGYQALVNGPNEPIHVSFDGNPAHGTGSGWRPVSVGEWLVYDIAGDTFRITPVEPGHLYKCACTMIDPGQVTGPDAEEPTYELDPLCPVHFDIEQARHHRSIDEAATAVIIEIANPTKVGAIANSGEIQLPPNVRDRLTQLATEAQRP